MQGKQPNHYTISPSPKQEKLKEKGENKIYVFNR